MNIFTPPTLDFAHQLKTAQGMEGRWSILLKEIQRLGFASVFYGVVPLQHLNSMYSQEGFEKCSHPSDYMERYDEAGHADHDYGIKICQLFETPQRWYEPRCLERFTPRELQVENEARDFGLKNGISIPLSSGSIWGGFGLNAGTIPDHEFEDILSRNLGDLIHVSHIFHSLAIDDGLHREIVRLSVRERECLLWAANGLPVQETASRLAITIDTANFHLANARRKLKARNTTHAVSKAITLNILHP